MSWDPVRDEPAPDRAGVIDGRSRRKRARLRRKASHDRSNALAVLIQQTNAGAGRQRSGT